MKQLQLWDFQMTIKKNYQKKKKKNQLKNNKIQDIM